MKLIYALPVLFGLFVSFDCRAACDLSQEIKKDPVAVLQQVVDVLKNDSNKSLNSIGNDSDLINRVIDAVKQDLKENPEILQEMVTAMQEKQTSEKSKAIRAYIGANTNKMTKRAPILGNRDAPKTIFIWTDFSCPYCRRVHGELSRVLDRRDDVRVVIKNFSIHGALSDGPAKAAIAAKMQDEDKAAKFIDMMMTREFYSQDDLKDQSKVASNVEKNIMKFAKEAGLDTDRLKKDMKSDTVSDELADVRDLAREFEINGTPFLVIQGEAFPGAIPYDQIVSALDK